MLLVLTANRGLCGGYNSSVQRPAWPATRNCSSTVPGGRTGSFRQAGNPGLRFRGLVPTQTFTHFEDKPTFAEVDVLANRYLQAYAPAASTGSTSPICGSRVVSRQVCRGRDFAPAGLAGFAGDTGKAGSSRHGQPPVRVSAVGREHSGRGRADELQGQAVQVFSRRGRQRAGLSDGGHEGGHGKRQRPDQALSMAYNRARQSQITGEIMEIIGGVEALK